MVSCPCRSEKLAFRADEELAFRAGWLCSLTLCLNLVVVRLRGGIKKQQMSLSAIIGLKWRSDQMRKNKDTDAYLAHVLCHF